MPEEIKQEVILKTQKYLGKYVKKPPLSEKLLKKPPFRFLHDVINTVIKETGFLKGLFSEEELNSENIKEKDAKLAFLNKLIDAVKTITSTDLAIRSSKIVAGLEPTETNLLLQTIGKAIDKKLDSSAYINKLQSGEIITEKNKKTKKASEKNDKTKKTSKTVINDEKKSTPRNNEKQTKGNLETPTSTDRHKSKRASKESKAETEDVKSKTKEKDQVKKKQKTKEKGSKEESQLINEDAKDVTDHSKEIPLELVKENKELEAAVQPAKDVNQTLTNEVINNIPIVEESGQEEIKTVKEISLDNEIIKKRTPSASRPKSARPKSGDLKEKLQEEKKESTLTQSRPRSSLRPPSVRPSSARPGAPRLRPDSGFPIKEVVPMGKINVIVENFDKDVDEEETVIIQSNPEITEEQNESINVPLDNKGHLVEQILEQINENDEKLPSKIENDLQRDGFQGKDTTAKETNNLRSLIQNLTKIANPLGKLLNYLHEDIDAMHAELESWSNIKRQLFEEISKQKKLGAEMNKPLITQLEHLNQEIKKIEEDIVTTRSNILRNETKIRELLAK